MPIQDQNDAVEVEERISRIFAASPEQRAAGVRGLFVEVLDFNPASGQVGLAGVAGNVHLPVAAERVAEMDGVHVLFIALPVPNTDRVRKTEVDAAAKTLADQLGDDLLLVFTNPSASQLHVILPSFTGARPTLRRMVLDRDLPRRTAVQQVSNIYWNYRASSSIRTALDQAFDVEPVTRDFFREYKGIFEAAEQSVTGFPDTDLGKEDRRSFVQTLFNRLMFVYFLSRKGWLTFQDNKDYLNTLWRDYQANSAQTNFYGERLRHLFFFGLNNPQSMDLNIKDSFMESIFGAVPFLNGGLFEETELDRLEDITVPDAAIEQVIRGLFDRFNFTVMESTPFDIEVAVDPEMLGKVFEELVTGRHDSGAYYTPRPVVSFMCREALKGYLEGQDTGLTSLAIARFVDAQETGGIQVAQARRVANALAQVTVVDPACGSGAYLLGMMQELIELQTALYNAGVDAKALYDLKLEIIQRNLYGVDLDDFAVNIAMLRMWLSLAIDFEGPTPEPLPNLDFKVVCGDSLLGPDPSAGVEVQGTLGQDMEQFRRLGERKAEYMKASKSADKERLKGDIGKLREEIREALGIVGEADGVMDWRVEFAEVFGQRRGFDVAIANPPYVQLQGNGGELANFYKDGGYSTFNRSGDLYYLFYERGINLLKDAGQLCYISSNQWMRVNSGKVLRQFLEKQNPVWLINLGADVFDSVTVNTCVILVNRSANRNALQTADVRQAAKQFPPSEWTHTHPANGEIWTVLSADEERIKAKMERVGIPLKDWDVSIKYGIKTGYDKAFVIDAAAKVTLAASGTKFAEIMKPVLRGRDIQRYGAEWAERWLIDTHNGHSHVPAIDVSNYPDIKAHLDKFYSQLEKRYDKGSTPYNLRNCAYHEEFAKEKIVWGNLNKQARFAYAPGGTFINAPTTMLTPYSPYLLAILNSTLLDWYFRQIGVERDGGYYEHKPMFIKRLPIPKITAEEQLPFVRLVDEILAAKSADAKADTRYLERAIDELVYALYGLTDEEDTAIERSLGLIHASDEEEDAALARMMEEYGPYGPEDLVSEETIRATLGAAGGS